MYRIYTEDKTLFPHAETGLLPDSDEMCDFSELVGKTIIKIVTTDSKDLMCLTCSDGTVFIMFHESECNEVVAVEDIAGDLEDIIGSPILQAEESSSNNTREESGEDGVGSILNEEWTFYKLATIKGSVTIRWYGSADEYYAASVQVYKRSWSKP